MLDVGKLECDQSHLLELGVIYRVLRGLGKGYQGYLLWGCV